MRQIKLGVMAPLAEGASETLRRVRGMGFFSCQVSCWQEELLTEENARALCQAAQGLGVEITTLWAGYPGRMVWNLTEGPSTIGLVPAEMRAKRLQALKRASDLAHCAGIPSITTHVGFIPENPADPLYAGLIGALREIARYCGASRQLFCLETGQETPVTLLRAIDDVGEANLGVNLDPANLLMYGKGNPLDALDIIGRYVRGVHAKDGEYPTNGRELGHEKPLGEGRVNFPALVGKLISLGYSGALTIEREISGPQQISDIQRARQFLTGILSQVQR